MYQNFEKENTMNADDFKSFYLDFMMKVKGFCNNESDKHSGNNLQNRKLKYKQLRIDY
jgi:formate dehydrogenase maturation protein FdhE